MTLSPAATRHPATPRSAPPVPARRVEGALGAIAAVLAVPLLGWAFVVPLTPGRLDRATGELVERLGIWRTARDLVRFGPEDTTLVAGLVVALAVVAFAAYGGALRYAWGLLDDRRALALVILVSVVGLEISALALPTANSDIFNYIVRGRIAAVHGENPYLVAADDHPDDPVHPYASHAYTGMPGGKLPAWMIVNVSLARIAGDDPVSCLLVYRHALVLFNVASLLLVLSILGRLAPGHRLAGAILFGWNPITLVYGPAKTDTVMVFYLLLGAGLLVIGRRRLAAVPLTLSVFVKLIPAPLLAVHLLRELRAGRWRDLAAGGGIAALTVLALYVPFSGPGLLPEHLSWGAEGGGAGTGSALQPWVLGGFGLLVLWTGLTRHPRWGTFPHGWILALLYFSLFLTNFSFAWYLLSLVAIASLARDGKLAAVVGVLCFSAVLVNSWESTSTSSFPLPDSGAIPRAVVYLAPVTALSALAAAVAWWRRARAASGSGSSS